MTRRLSAASKRPHLPTCSHRKHTTDTGKSQGEEGTNQQLLIVLLGLRKLKHEKPHKTTEKETLQTRHLYAILVLLKNEVKMMALQESGEMYLETIYVLGKANSQVRSVDIAEHMGYSKPSVSRAVHLLEEKAYIIIDDNGQITLTESGRTLAEKIFERHTVISGMLMRLGVDPETAAEDACRMEHAISDVTFEAIKRHMQHMG